MARLHAGSVLSQHTHSESGEMNEWEAEDSEEGEEMDGGSEGERKAAEKIGSWYKLNLGIGACLK